ncbi:MAG: hypothetical protein GX076_01245 [Clostridiales bacterium]|nr:hypothetical protein [Clostridiales bacterium]
MGQMIPLSLQHLFAMFGASVLVPMLVGVNPALQLLFNGIGTLLYIAITRGKIPAFLGPSAAFVAGIGAVIASEGHAAALAGCIAVGILFVVVGYIVKKVGIGWIDVVLPPAMGAVVATIGLGLAEYSAGLAGLIPGSVAPEMQGKTIAVSMFTLAVAILVSVLCRGFIYNNWRGNPLLLGGGRSAALFIPGFLYIFLSFLLTLLQCCKQNSHWTKKSFSPNNALQE